MGAVLIFERRKDGLAGANRAGHDQPLREARASDGAFAPGRGFASGLAFYPHRGTALTCLVLIFAGGRAGWLAPTGLVMTSPYGRLAPRMGRPRQGGGLPQGWLFARVGARR